MQITSPAFQNNEPIPDRYSRDEDDINPPLDIAGVPANTITLALLLDDPDAPGGTFVHWLVYNIPPDTLEITEGTLPIGAVEAENDYGQKGYGGPQPPSGTHRYVFKLFALDTDLHLESDAICEDFYDAIEGHILETAELVGVYTA
jgi:Raf kinase inhibitor-like YbhB/YbcL family protein